MKRRLDSAQIDGSNTKKQRVLPNTEENNWLDLLPIELVKQILEYLNDDDKRHARLANQRIFSILNITHFNIGFVLSSEIDELVSVFGRYPHPISLTFAKPLTNPKDLQKISKLVNLKLLHARHSTVEVDQMTNLQSLELDEVRVTSEFPKLIQLTSLQARTLSRISGLPTSLQKLKYNVSAHGFDATEVYSNMTALEGPAENIEVINRIMPNVKRISFYNYENNIKEICGLTGLEDLTVTSNVVKNDLNAQLLTKLFIAHSPLHFNWSHFKNLTNLKDLQLCEWSNQINLKTLPHLERLEIIGWNVYSVVSVDPSMISAATRLTRLKIVLTNQAEFNAIVKLTRLQVLHVTKTSEEITELDLTSLKNLTRLTRFRLSIVGPPCSVKNAKVINKLPNLVKLVLANVQDLNSPKTPFMNLSRLTHLALNQCYWISLYSESAYPRDLQHLHMYFSVSGGLNPSTINLTVLTNLTYLFTNDHVSWQDVAKLTKLKELHLTHEPERDDDIAIFTTLVGLTYLTFESDFNVSYHVMRLTRLSRLQVLEVNATNDIPALDDLKERCKYLRDKRNLLFGL